MLLKSAKKIVREFVMKTKTLAALVALSIGVSPIGIMSAGAQDAPILPKKGGAQSGDQSGGTATQQPYEDEGSSRSDSAGTSSGQEAQQPSDGSSAADATGTSTDGSSTQPAPQPADQTQPGSSSEDGSDSSRSSTPKPGQSSMESDSSGDSQDSGNSSGSGETQKSGDAAKSSGGSTETQSDTTTNVNISVEQKTEIREVVKEVRVEPVREVDFTVSVGTSIPRKFTLEPLPQRIVEIVPQYAGYRFFILADGRIVIVDPAAYTIVYIIV